MVLWLTARQPPSTKLSDRPLPCTPLFRSRGAGLRGGRAHHLVEVGGGPAGPLDPLHRLAGLADGGDGVVVHALGASVGVEPGRLRIGGLPAGRCALLRRWVHASTPTPGIPLGSRRGNPGTLVAPLEGEQCASHASKTASQPPIEGESTRSSTTSTERRRAT